MAEAAFQDHLWRPNLEPLRDVAVLNVIRCRTDPSIARQRVARRPRRSAHADRSVLESDRYFEEFEALSLPVETIDVDTTREYRPSFGEVVAFISSG